MPTEEIINVVNELNRARADPPAYADYLRDFIKCYNGLEFKQDLSSNVIIMTKEGVSAVKEAIQFLENTKPMGTVQLSSGMSLAAADHVADHGEAGITSHDGTDGSRPADRISRYGKWHVTCAENLDYGSDTGEAIIRSLIVDDGVADRGHRTNIFNPQFTTVGVAIGSHSKYRVMCAMEFAGGFTEASNDDKIINLDGFPSRESIETNVLQNSNNSNIFNNNNNNNNNNCSSSSSASNSNSNSDSNDSNVIQPDLPRLDTDFRDGSINILDNAFHQPLSTDPSKTDIRTCPKCLGKGGWGQYGACGKDDNKYIQDCPCCQGAGVIPDDVKLTKCTTCNTQGAFSSFGPCQITDPLFSHKCATCDGKGFVEIFYAKRSGTPLHGSSSSSYYDGNNQQGGTENTKTRRRHRRVRRPVVSPIKAGGPAVGYTFGSDGQIINRSGQCLQCKGKGGWGAFGACLPSDVHFRRVCHCCNGHRVSVHRKPCAGCQSLGCKGRFGPCPPHSLHVLSLCNTCHGRGFI